MTDVGGEADVVAWRTVVEQLGRGNIVEIPCQFERDFVRRSVQASKRAARNNLKIEILREEGGLRLIPQGAHIDRASDSNSGDHRVDIRPGPAEDEDQIRASRLERRNLGNARGAGSD